MSVSVSVAYLSVSVIMSVSVACLLSVCPSSLCQSVSLSSLSYLCMRVCARTLSVVSMDKISRVTNILIVINYV